MLHALPVDTVALLDLFEGPLRDVRFPDADADRLNAVVEEAAVARDALVLAEAAVEAARAALAEKQTRIAQETERTLAYARIYAAARPELLAALDAIALPTRQVRQPRRGRPRKVASTPQEAAAAAE